jgi:hypothetical protein
MLDHKLPPPALSAARAQPLVTTVPKQVPPGERASARVLLTDAGVKAFRDGLIVSALLVAAGGLISVVGVRNRPRPVASRVSEATPSAATP